jgi:nucleoside-diphosphate-sugar epimerase
MRILLTGGTGFIGSHFLKQALEAGHKVLALRRNNSRKPRIAISNQPIWLDCDMDAVRAVNLGGCDALVHLAAHSVEYPFDNLSNCLYFNVISALSLFEQARISGIRHFVVAGSCFEYGRSGEKYEAIPTDAPLEPNSSYAISKASASMAFSQWANEHKVDLTILRLFHVYGYGEAESRFWPSLRRAALAGESFRMSAGEQIRDFTAVETAAKIFLQQATCRENMGGTTNIYNVGSGQPRSLLSFAKEWWSIWEAKGELLDGMLPYRENECMRYIAGENLLSTEEASM